MAGAEEGERLNERDRKIKKENDNILEDATTHF